MFKPRRAPVRRCRESRHFARKGNRKQYKPEGNSNITSNRVTIAPGFLCLGVGSRAVRRSPYKENFDSNRDLILTENLQGLLDGNLNENYRPRRSSRLTRKSEGTQNYDCLTASDYYNRDLRSQKSDQTKEESDRSPSLGNYLVKNNSKSLFRKINERCARAQAKDPKNFNYPISAVRGSDSKVEYFRPSTFCLDLSAETYENLNPNDYVLKAKLAVKEKIRIINNQLQGKMNPGNASPKKKNQMEGDGTQNNFRYIPSCDWVYKTPPRQRVVLPKAEQCAIQPAVICTVRRKNNLYELNPNVQVDLTRYANRQHVEVDGRYMRQVGCFDGRVEADLGFRVDKVMGSDQVDLESVGCSFLQEPPVRKEFHFVNSPSQASQFFMSVTSRPTKTVKKMSRIGKFYARKSEGGPDGTPTNHNLYQCVEEFERDFTFMEDDGKYKMVSTQSARRDGNFNFNFRKNLFKEDDGKLFHFDTEEPNMFNFALLKEN